MDVIYRVNIYAQVEGENNEVLSYKMLMIVIITFKLISIIFDLFLKKVIYKYVPKLNRNKPTACLKNEEQISTREKNFS